jgi:hypothetical protein
VRECFFMPPGPHQHSVSHACVSLSHVCVSVPYVCVSVPYVCVSVAYVCLCLSQVIMVGAGTGLAPLRGMCHHIQERRKKLEEGQTHGTHVLIFGCRRRDHDFL